MAEEDGQVTQTDLDMVLSQIAESLNSFAGNIEQKINEIAATVEAQEQTVANLIIGFAEQAVMVESLIGQLSYGTEEERAAFRKSVDDGRKAMFQIMQEQIDVVGETDPEAASTLERLVEQRQAATPNE